MFAVLLNAGCPVTVGEVVAALHSAGVTTPAGVSNAPNKVMADMLGYQVRAGRVRRVDRATYQVVAASLSRSTQRRCRRWREMLSSFDE